MRNILISLLTCAALTGGSGVLSESAGASQLLRETLVEAIRVGQASIEAGAPEQALAAFQAAVEADPSQPMAWFGLARAHRQNGDEASAKAAIREAKRRIAGADDAERAGILGFQQGISAEHLVAMR
ncbi:MAG: tetratricopeptide repeat protein [Planctomycetes bacterium]|nr:tetratricopeptide repeat protein [Planctomycetota bacterium]